MFLFSLLEDVDQKGLAAIYARDVLPVFLSFIVFSLMFRSNTELFDSIHRSSRATVTLPYKVVPTVIVHKFERLSQNLTHLGCSVNRFELLSVQASQVNQQQSHLQCRKCRS